MSSWRVRKIQMIFDPKKLNKPLCEKHTQIVHYDNGSKLTLTDIVCVWQDTLVHMISENGRHYMVNPHRVLHTEILWNTKKNSKK